MQHLVEVVEKNGQSKTESLSVWIKDLGDLFASINLIADLESLNSVNTSADKKKEIEVRICESFYKLARQTLLHDVYPLFQFLKKRMREILDVVKLPKNRKLITESFAKNTRRVNFKKGNWLNRELLEEPVLEAPLELTNTASIIGGDATVLVKANDNMFSSVIGNDGLPVDGSAVPMNLSLIFP